MFLTSPAFEDGGMIPQRFTASDANALPPLHIAGVPQAARSLAIVLEDIDSPLGLVTHWMVWNIPPETGHLEAGALPDGCCEGLDTFGEHGYLGPAPAEGRHRYRFRLLALDVQMVLADGATRADFDKSVSGHVIEESVLTVYRQAGTGCLDH